MPVDQYADDEEQRLIVQYRIEGHGRDTDHDKRVAVENLLGEFLEDADLGYCDGGDIGSGTMNVFCEVAAENAVTACKAIVAKLETAAIEGVVIAFLDDEDEDAEPNVLYPEGFAGTFSVL